MTLYEWMKQQRELTGKHYETFSPANQDEAYRAERTRARRMNVAWNYAIIEIDLLDGEPEDLDDAAVKKTIAEWVDHTEDREDLRMNDGNLELRECMLKVGEQILQRP